MSPGRARSSAAAMAVPRSGDQQQVVVATLAGRFGAARDGIEDHVAVLVARVLVGHDHQAGPLARDPAHERALGRVTLAGRAEHRDQPAATGRRDRREQVEHGLERGRAVGVIDDDPERLAGLDPFHPPRDRGEPFEPRSHGARIQPDGLAERDHREGVVDVEPSGQLQRQGPAARGRRVRDPQAVGILLDARGPDVGRGVRPIRQHPGTGLLRHADEAAGGGVVEVDDAGPGPRAAGRLGRGVAPGPEAFEERELGVAVGLEAAVELEVLVGDVGQDRDVVGDRPDAFEREAVGGALDDRRGVARQGHGTQRELEGGCLGRRDMRLIGFLDGADPRSGGPDHPGPHARRLERGDREERCRGLAVGAGDPDDVQLPARIVVPPCGGGRERRMGIRHDELRQGDLGQRARDDRGRRTGRGGRGHEVMPVHGEPGGRDEERAWRGRLASRSSRR